MIEINNDTRQFVITKKEASKLAKELENTFCIVDTTSVSSMSYCGDSIQRRYPLMWGLFCTLNK